MAQREPTAEQREMLYGLARTYNLARIGEISREKFWEVTIEEWLLRWPVVPDLVGRGTLPMEAATGVDLTDPQQAVVEAELTAVRKLMKEVVEDEWNRWREECDAIAYGGGVQGNGNGEGDQF